MKRVIRTLTPPEVGVLLDWARVEGWNPGLADAPAFRAADPDGFIGAFDGDEMVAGISAVSYAPNFGFIGLYIVRPDRRGQGHGKAVWEAGMARLARRTVGLDGVPAQQENYAGQGFVTAYDTVRMTAARPDLPVSGSVVPVAPDLLPALLAFDRRAFPAGRTPFLCAWLGQPRRALACVEDRVLRGYGVVRQCVDGCKIGPLFAEDARTALRLLAALADRLPGPIQVDVPARQAPFLAELGRHGFEPGFATARMYRGRVPAIDGSLVFGATTLELG